MGIFFLGGFFCLFLSCLTGYYPAFLFSYSSLKTSDLPFPLFFTQLGPTAAGGCGTSSTFACSFTLSTGATDCCASSLGFSYTTASTIAGFPTTASCFALPRGFSSALAASTALAFRMSFFTYSFFFVIAFFNFCYLVAASSFCFF